MRVLVCGGRKYTDYELVKGTLDHMSARVIIHGGASGADSLAGRWAKERGIPVEVYPAQWAEKGRAAGPIRNARMLAEGRPDVVVAFPGGRGTADMVGKARTAGVRVCEVWR